MVLPSLQPIEAVLTLSFVWIGLGALGPAFGRSPRAVINVTFLVLEFIHPEVFRVALTVACDGVASVA